jgi:hypothetical protein
VLTEKQLRKTRRTPDGHLLWTGALANGHPAVKQGSKTVYVKRLLWEVAKGPVPVGMVVVSMCGERACVEITHLALSKPGRYAGRKDAAGRYTPTVRDDH